MKHCEYSKFCAEQERMYDTLAHVKRGHAYSPDDLIRRDHADALINEAVRQAENKCRVKYYAYIEHISHCETVAVHKTRQDPDGVTIFIRGEIRQKYEPS